MFAEEGPGKVVDIERESKLGGEIHSKGVMILSAYLANRFARNNPLPIAATVVFEQSYGAVDGDSASCAELCVLLSAIAYRRGSHELAGRLWGAIVGDEAHLRVVEADLELVAVVERLREADERAFVAAASSEREHLTLERAAALALRPDGLVPA